MMKERRYDIDWLRAIVLAAVFFFHCSCPFRSSPWILNNAEWSPLVDIFGNWLSMWFMPLFFLLSGVGSRYALQSVSTGRYVSERIKRLALPLYTTGLYLLLPISSYFWIVNNAHYHGSFWEMLPEYFAGMGLFSIARPGDLLHVPFHGHLWFLQFLFLISLVSLPLLRYLRSEQGLHRIDIMAESCRRGGGIFLFLIPLLLVRVGLQNLFPDWHSWADFFEYLVFFLVGYILPADIRFTESIRNHGLICLVLGLAGYVGANFYSLILGLGEPFSWKFMLYHTMYGIGRWSWIVFFLSLASKYLTRNNKALSYCNEAVLPFYILHEPVIVLVGWQFIPMNLGILPKYLIIASVSFVLIAVLYEFIIRRFIVMRFFFGMRINTGMPAPSPLPEI